MANRAINVNSMMGGIMDAVSQFGKNPNGNIKEIGLGADGGVKFAFHNTPLLQDKANSVTDASQGISTGQIPNQMTKPQPQAGSEEFVGPMQGVKTPGMMERFGAGIKEAFAPENAAGLSRLFAQIAQNVEAPYTQGQGSPLTQSLIQMTSGQQMKALREGKELSGIGGYGITAGERSQLAGEMMAGRKEDRADKAFKLQKKLARHKINLDEIEQFTADDKILIARIGASGRGATQKVAINVGPDGEQTPARDKHYWALSADNKPLIYIGPATTPAPAGPQTPVAVTGNVNDYLTREFINDATMDEIERLRLEGKTDDVAIREAGMKIRQLNDPTTGRPDPNRLFGMLSNTNQQKWAEAGTEYQSGNMAETFRRRTLDRTTIIP